jgi:hypothetical protein
MEQVSGSWSARTAATALLRWPRRRRLAELLAPFALYLVGVMLLGDWIIDDAGITFGYSHSIATGQGFVSQPGRTPVEGISNVLWMLLLVPLQALRLFHPIWTPKILGALLVLAAFRIVQRTLARRPGGAASALTVNLALAACPPIVIWTASGLENGLTLMLLLALWATGLDRPRHWQLRCGTLTALLAMTHPEGVLYVGVGIAACLGSERTVARRALGWLGSFVRYALGFGAIFGPFMAYRLTRFGLPWPQPYYAKRITLSHWERLRGLWTEPAAVQNALADLGRAIVGAPGPWLLLLCLGGVLTLLALGRLRRDVGLTAVLAAVACLAYAWMDPDWMGEFRFATGAVVALVLCLVVMAHALVRDVGGGRGRGWVVGGCALMVLGVLGGGAPRLLRFALQPPTSFRDVERQWALPLEAYARLLGGQQASVLLADVGAPLVHGQLGIHDVTGLIEPEATRALKAGGVVWRLGHPDFHRWVFERLRPTFICTRAFWTRVAALEDDPRFVRDYVPIDAYDDSYVLSVYGLSLHSGDYVRRDALTPEISLERLRAAGRPTPRPVPLAWRLVNAWHEWRVQDEPSAAASLRSEARASAADWGDAQHTAWLFARLLELDPRDREATLGLARALDAAGRANEARPVWVRVAAHASADGDSGLAAMAQRRLGDPRLPGAMPVERPGAVPLPGHRRP